MRAQLDRIVQLLGEIKTDLGALAVQLEEIRNDLVVSERTTAATRPSRAATDWRRGGSSKQDER